MPMERQTSNKSKDAEQENRVLATRHFLLGRCWHPVLTLTLYFPDVHLYFYYLFVFPSALSNIIILPSKTGPRQDKCLDRTATQSSGLFFGRCQETSRTMCTIQVGYAKARWCCFPRCLAASHHILWQQRKLDALQLTLCASWWHLRVPFI